MLISINNAQRAVPNYWWTLPLMNAVVVAIFLVTTFKNVASTECIIYSLFAAVFIGFIVGFFATYRFVYDSLVGIFAIICYFIFGICTSISASVFAVEISGHLEFRYLSIFVNVSLMMVTLLAGIYLNAKDFGIFRITNKWREEIEKHINYSKREVSPSLTGDTSNFSEIKHPYWILAVILSNIPLLFELYGGGKINAVFLAVPILTGTFAYINIKTIGPALIRLLLLRKIEKEVGYRFQNADYEKIQELRRGFVLARWLMKDYRPPQTQAAAGASGIQKDNVAKKKKRKRGK